jgi:hypothetical protein
MAEERDEEKLGGTEGQAGQQQSAGQQDRQDRQSTMSGQDNRSSGGQQTGGDDSSSGSPQSQGSSGQAQPDSDTLTTDQDDDAARGSTSQGGPQGEGFIGSQGTGSDDYLRQDGQSGGSPSPDATGGSDFANQGRGALDEEQEDDSGTGSTGGESA